MKQILTPAILSVSLAMPLAAEDQKDNGFNLMEKGARLLFEGLMQEMTPALRDLEGLSAEMELALRGFAENMGPGLKVLLGQVEDFSKYHPPEILPNGDIIIRRKTPQELGDETSNGDIEL